MKQILAKDSFLTFCWQDQVNLDEKYNFPLPFRMMKEHLIDRKRWKRINYAYSRSMHRYLTDEKLHHPTCTIDTGSVHRHIMETMSHITFANGNSSKRIDAYWFMSRYNTFYARKGWKRINDAFLPHLAKEIPGD